MIYADQAATTRMSETAAQAMLSVLRENYGNPSSLHSMGQKAKETLEEARRTVAEAIGADPGEILFTSGGSEADNQAILSAAELGRQKGKMHIRKNTAKQMEYLADNFLNESFPVRISVTIYNCFFCHHNIF